MLHILCPYPCISHCPYFLVSWAYLLWAVQDLWVCNNCVYSGSNAAYSLVFLYMNNCLSLHEFILMILGPHQYCLRVLVSLNCCSAEPHHQLRTPAWIMPPNLHVSAYFMCIGTVVSKVSTASKICLPPLIPCSLPSGTSWYCF